MAKERVARGVRKVNETITQEGRALVLTEKEADSLLWDDIPVGSIRVNDQTGAWSVKVEGETDWIPGGIKNDGTLNVIKDTKVSVETFIIKQLEVPGTKREFTYYYDSQEDEAHVRHGIILYKNALGMCGEYGQYGTYPTWTECKRYLLLDNDAPENQYKNTQKVGYIFSLEQGDYAMYRNHLKIAIDDILHRSVKSGGVKEISETRFCLTEDHLENGMEITAEYVHTFRLGNPYPRTFVNPNEPERSAAEVGDFWLDTDGTLADDDPLGDYIEDDGMLDWSRIRPDTRPSSIAGYGIKDKLSYEGHTHVPADILGIEKVKVDNAKHADSADLATDATNAVNANYATSAGTAREAAKATNADNANLATRALNADNAANAAKAKNAEKAANADNAAEANHAATATNATNAANANEAKHAATASKADNATRATNADNAANANRAKEADHAATATRATNADNAANANHASIADRATKADTATRATNADNAREAAHAASATSANTATTASTATTATRALNADKASVATTATTANTANSATVATRATNDGDGRNIVNTYALKSDLNNANARLNGNEFVKNDTTAKKISLKYETENGKNVVAPYVDGVKVPLSTQGSDNPKFEDKGGYCKFSNGLIMQWGKHADPADKLVKIFYPIPFPHKFLNIMVTSQNDILSGADMDNCAPIVGTDCTNSYFTANTDGLPTGEKDWNYFWFAIGY